MPGVGLAAPSRVALGENARMLVGGDAGGVGGGAVWIRFVNGVADFGGAELDVTDNMSGGNRERSRGPRESTIVADCFYRTADNPFGNLPAFVELEETPRIILWPDLVNDQNQYIKYPVGFCQGFQIVVAGTAETRFTLRLANQGRYYHPGRKDPNGVFAL